MKKYMVITKNLLTKSKIGVIVEARSKQQAYARVSNSVSPERKAYKTSIVQVDNNLNNGDIEL